MCTGAAKATQKAHNSPKIVFSIKEFYLFGDGFLLQSQLLQVFTVPVDMAVQIFVSVKAHVAKAAVFCQSAHIATGKDPFFNSGRFGEVGIIKQPFVQPGHQEKIVDKLPIFQ